MASQLVAVAWHCPSSGHAGSTVYLPTCPGTATKEMFELIDKDKSGVVSFQKWQWQFWELHFLLILEGGSGGFQMTLPLVTSGLGDFAKPLRCGLGVKTPRLDSFKISKSQVANIAVTPMPQPGFRMTPFSMGPFCWKSTAKRVQNHVFFSRFRWRNSSRLCRSWRFGSVWNHPVWAAGTGCYFNDERVEEVVHFGQSMASNVQRCLKVTSWSLVSNLKMMIPKFGISSFWKTWFQLPGFSSHCWNYI